MSQPIPESVTNSYLSRLNPLLLPLPWLVVVILIVAFFIIKYSDTTQEAINSQQPEKEFPYVFMTNVDLREFSVDGTLHYQLKTPLIRHFQANEKASGEDYTRFDLPQIVFLGDGQKPAWYISSQSARSDTNGDLLTLTQDVLAQHTSPTQGMVSISTTELSLNTREQFAQTDKAVTMSTAKGHVSAQGLRADIKQEHFTLSSKVKGSYEP